MPSTVTSRIEGLTTSVAVKAPVRIMASGPVTLYGEQSITATLPNGLEVTETVLAGQRVGVNGQADARDNGIYVVSTTSWKRALDFDGSLDAVYGTIVTDEVPVVWQLTTPVPVLFGTSEIHFDQRTSFNEYDDSVLRADLSDSNPAKGAALVRGAIRHVGSISELRDTVGLYDGDIVWLTGYYSDTPGRACANFRWDAASTAADDGGITIGTAATGRWVRQFTGSTVQLEWFGALNDADAIPHLRAARDYLASIGGGVIRASGRYLVDSGNLEVDDDNIWVIGYGEGVTVFERTSSQNGFAFWWARNNNTNGGGLAHCTLKGTTTNATGNGGVAFGYDSDPVFNKANSWLLMNVTCRDWSQYGVGINSGDNWLAKDVNVLDHGITSGNLASCIAFYVYPKSTSSNGRLHNIRAEISAASEAVSNGAALKLQTHSNLQAEMLYAKGGAEQCVSIDSISGTVRNLTARANGAKPGVAVLNYNSAHSFSGKFVLDGVDCNDPLFSVSFVIAAAASGELTPRLKGVTIKNVRCALVRVNSRSAWQDCAFENFYCTDAFRLDHGTAGVTPPELPITGNKYSNIYARSIEIAGDSGEILDCASTGNQFLIYGSNNTADNIRSIKSSGNGIAVEGSNNTVTNLLSRSATGRKLWIKSGDANLFQGVTVGGTAILNSGTNTNTTNVVQL